MSLSEFEIISNMEDDVAGFETLEFGFDSKNAKMQMAADQSLYLQYWRQKGNKKYFSNDGKVILCSCGSQVNVVDIESGKVVNKIGKDDEDTELASFVLGYDDRVLITSLRNGLLQQWDIIENKQIRTWKSIHTGPITCMAFDTTTTLVATGGSDSTIKVWDIIRQYCTHNLKGAQGVFSVVSFHPIEDRKEIFGAASDYQIRVWNLNTSQCIHTLEGHYSVVTSVTFTEDGSKLLSSSRDKVVILWDLNSYVMLKTFPIYESVQSVMVIPSGRMIPNINMNSDHLYFVTAGEKGILCVWDCNTGGKVFSQESPVTVSTKDAEAIIMKATYISAKNLIGIVTYEHNIILYDTENFELQKQFSGHNDDILDIKCLGKDNSHIAVATNSPHIKIFNLSTFNCQLLRGHTDLVISIDVFPTKPHFLISGSKDDTICVWKMNKCGEVRCLYIGHGHTHSVNAVACSGSNHLTFISGSQDTTIKLWKLPKKISKETSKQALSPQYTIPAHEKTINSIAVSPNDKLVATGSQDKTAKVWNMEDLSFVGIVKGHRRGIWCVQFSPLDQVLTTSSADGTIKMWSLSDFICVKTFEGHECSVLKIIFLNSGKQLMSSGSDGNIKVWIIKTNENIKTLDAHTDKVWAMTTNASEDIVITGGADSSIIIWKDVTLEEKEKESVKRENLILQEQELSNLIKERKWFKALSLAITLEQPFRTFNIIREILLDSEGRLNLENTIMKLREDQIDTLLTYCVTWNTNSKHCYPAQVIVSLILRNFTAEELLKFPNAQTSIQELLPYTERHFRRISRTLQQTMFINYMMQNMKVAL